MKSMKHTYEIIDDEIRYMKDTCDVTKFLQRYMKDTYEIIHVEMKSMKDRCDVLKFQMRYMKIDVNFSEL